MACTRVAPCGGVLRPDVDFNATMDAEGLRRRRESCLNGHSFFTTITGRTRRGRYRAARCVQCGRAFTRYCTEAAPAPRCCSRRCRTLRASACRRRVTPATAATIVARYAKGEPMYRIARDLGLGQHTVDRALKRAGVPRRRRSNTVKCVVGDCGAAPWKRPNSKGIVFGRRCRPHELAHWRAKRRERDRAMAAAA